MTTLLQEFEAWLKREYESDLGHDYDAALLNAQKKLEELKKKHNVT
jgi:hypothetical protein